MSCSSWNSRPLVLAAALITMAAAASCQSQQKTGTRAEREQRIGPGQVTPAEIQSKVMTFADMYAVVLGESLDDLMRQTTDPAIRADAHRSKLSGIQDAITIAAGPNPVVAMLDMTIMVTLQRMVAEEYLVPEVLHEEGEPILASLQLLETEAWEIAETALDARTQAELRQLIESYRDRYTDVRQLARLRATDFADARQASVVREQGSGNLLSLIHLDPMAGLSPASREIAQSRLLAERVFFYVKRAPSLMKWQAEDLVLDTIALPETQGLMTGAAETGAAVNRVSNSAADFLDRLPEERTVFLDEVNQRVTGQREAAMDRLDDVVATEREAAIDQIFQGVAEEREAIIARLESEEARLQGVLENMRLTVDASNALATTIQATVVSATELTAMVAEMQANRPPAPAEPGPPFDITQYQATADAATRTVEQLNQLLGSAIHLLESPGLTTADSTIAQVAGEGRIAVDSLIDRVYRRALTLIIVFIVGLLAAMLIYRIVSWRLTLNAAAAA